MSWQQRMDAGLCDEKWEVREVRCGIEYCPVVHCIGEGSYTAPESLEPYGKFSPYPWYPDNPIEGNVVTMYDQKNPVNNLPFVKVNPVFGDGEEAICRLFPFHNFQEYVHAQLMADAWIKVLKANKAFVDACSAAE